MDSQNLSAGKSDPSAKAEQGKILIVEDNQMNQRLAGFMLKTRGLKFDVSGSGEDALRKLQNDSFSLVLMDIEMPGMNGYECTQKIREQLMMKIPVVAMTAHDRQEDKDKCHNAGMDDYLLKPIDENAFNDVLQRYLS